MKPQCRGSPENARFRDSHAGVPGQNGHLDATPATSHRVNPLRGGGATAPSVIREIEKVQGGEQAPRDGSLALLKDMIVEPFGPKGLLNV
jgi:hypothetical protein